MHSIFCTYNMVMQKSKNCFDFFTQFIDIFDMIQSVEFIEARISQCVTQNPIATGLETS